MEAWGRDMIYDVVIGAVEEDSDNPDVKTVFGEDSLCEKLYEEIYQTKERLNKRLGKEGEEDADIEKIINNMFEELKDMIANARGEQDVSKWEKDIDSLTYNCECIGICDYMEITEEAARIMKESGSDEIVYYSKELDMYIWGITHYGTSWKLMLTSIPIPEDNAA